MDYEKDIKIEQSALDVEWLQQSTLTFRYTKHAAQMGLELTKVKEQMNLVRAELDKKIRKNPNDYGLEKVTETPVANAILEQKEFQAIQSKYNDAVYEYDIAQGAVRALADKKSALENLVRLHGQSYFAGPSVPRDLSKEWEAKETRAESNSKVAGSLRRRRPSQETE